MFSFFGSAIIQSPVPIIPLMWLLHTTQQRINLPFLHTWPHPLEQHSWPSSHFLSAPHSSEQIPKTPSGTSGHTAEEWNKQEIKNTESKKDSFLQRLKLLRVNDTQTDRCKTLQN